MGIIPLLSCTEVEQELTIKIYGQGAGYSGAYIVDGASEESTFECTASTSDVYQYTETVFITEKIEIDIFPLATDDDDDDKDETDMTGLTCKIYDGSGDIVYETNYTIHSTVMKSFIYRLGDETDSDD